MPTTCKNARCNETAIWTVTTTGHPEGAEPLVVNYCADHVFMPTWHESPTPYTITITGPHREA